MGEAPRLRPATPGDRELLLEIFASTRTRELAMLASDEQRRWFVNQQHAARAAQYARSHPRASYDVVVVGGREAGTLVVDREGTEICLVDIALLPAFRGRGVGTKLVQSLLDEGAAQDKAVTLQVDAQNPARRLYQRLGFRCVGRGDVYVRMTSG